MNINIGDICLADFTNDNDRFTGIRPCLIVSIKDNEYKVLKLHRNREIMQNQGIIIKKGIKTGLEYDSALVKYSGIINSKLIIKKVGSFNLNYYIGKSVKFNDKLGNIHSGVVLRVIPQKRTFIVSYEHNGMIGYVFVPIHVVVEVEE